MTFTENEGYEEAISIQQQYVSYMYVQDLAFKEGIAFTSSEVSRLDETERNVYIRIAGEGILAWPDILEKVNEKRYDGWLPFEYERRWHPDDNLMHSMV